MEPPILEPSWKIYRLDDRDKVYAPGVEKNGRDKMSWIFLSGKHLSTGADRYLNADYISGRYGICILETHCVPKLSHNILLPHKMYFGVLLSGGHVRQHVRYAGYWHLKQRQKNK
jgi:hypothetical protein